MSLTLTPMLIYLDPDYADADTARYPWLATNAS
jgi:hypothetical protein